MEASAKNLDFATWLRAFSMLLILACHYCAECSVSVISMLGQIFNIGVQLFFILSGFLTGYKGIAHPCTKWYLRRLKRIYIPYWMFLFGLAVIHISKGMNIFTKNWLLLWLGVQGSHVGVWGAGHTWFVSVLLLCYLLSPVILSANRKLQQMKKRGITILIYGGVCVLPVLYAIAESEWVYTLLTPISLYSMACVYGASYRENAGYSRHKKYLPLYCAVIATAFGIRFAARMVIDGTLCYDRILVPYTHMIAATAIWLIFETLFAERKLSKVIQNISDFSFEIYLWHYMFVVGPVSIFKTGKNWMVACVVTTIVVFAVSLLTNQVKAFLFKISFKNFKK